MVSCLAGRATRSGNIRLSTAGGVVGVGVGVGVGVPVSVAVAVVGGPGVPPGAPDPGSGPAARTLTRAAAAAATPPAAKGPDLIYHPECIVVFRWGEAKRGGTLLAPPPGKGVSRRMPR